MYTQTLFDIPDSYGCFTTTPQAPSGVQPLRQSPAGMETRVRLGVSPKGDRVVASPALSELILAVVGYGPPPQRRALLIRLAPRALVGYSPIRLALMALASEPPRPTRARRSVGDTPQGGH